MSDLAKITMRLRRVGPQDKPQGYRLVFSVEALGIDYTHEYKTLFPTILDAISAGCEAGMAAATMANKAMLVEVKEEKSKPEKQSKTKAAPLYVLEKMEPRRMYRKCQHCTEDSQFWFRYFRGRWRKQDAYCRVHAARAAKRFGIKLPE